MKKNTRTADLDLLTLKAEENEKGDEHIKAIREQVYEQSKDAYLEKKRNELTEWIQRGLYAYSSSSPHKTQQMAEAEMNIDRIEREIKMYTGSESFQKVLAGAAARIANSEAELFVKKGGLNAN